MDVGSRRLVARANYRSILASFDGVRAVWTTKDKLAVTLAYTAPVTREPADAASALDNEVALDAQFDNVRLGVAHIEMPLPGDLRGELYLLDLRGRRRQQRRHAQPRSRDARRPPAPPARQAASSISTSNTPTRPARNVRPPTRSM